MRRYNGNTGRYEYINDAPQNRSQSGKRNGHQSRSVPSEQKPVTAHKQKPPERDMGGLQKLLSNLFSQGFENEDLLLFAVLFLMYQETHDKELLIIMGGMFLL